MIYISFFLFSLSFLWPAHFEPLPLFYQNSFILFSLMLLLANFKRLTLDSLSIIFITLFLIIVIIEYLVNKSINDNAKYFFITVVITIFSYLLGINYRDNLKNIKLFIPAYIFTVLVLFLIQIFQVYHIDSIYIKYISATSNRYYSNTGQPNILATIYVTAIAYLNISRNKKIYLILIAIFTLGVFLTKSRVGYLSLFICCLLSFIFTKEFKLKQLIRYNYPFILLLFLFTINYFSQRNFLEANRLSKFSNSRIDLYKDAVNLISDKPIVGYGWESAHKYIPKDNIIYFQSPTYSYHNLFIDLALSYGLIIAGFIFVVFCCLIWKNRFNNIKVYIVSLPFLIHCLVEFPYYYWYLLMPFMFILGFTNTKLLNNKAVSLNRSYILFFILFAVFLYKSFYDEYELISTNYLRIYNSECMILPNKDWRFFADNAEQVNYFCLKDYDKASKKRIVDDSLKYVLLIDYVKNYELKDGEIRKYACLKYNYSCRD